MAAADTYRRELIKLQEKDIQLGKELHRHEQDAAKASEESRKKSAAAGKSSNPSTMRSNQTAADKAQQRSLESTKKATAVKAKLAQNAKDQAAKKRSLAAAEKTERTAAEKDVAKRRQTEVRHVKDIAMLSQAPYRYVHLQPPQPEKLRVLYLTANADLSLRVDVEVRQVQQAIRGAKHRDLVELQYRPAARYQDLLDGLNDVQPHIVHFSGHGGGKTLSFDSGEVEEAEFKSVSFRLLIKALAATDKPPVMLVMNACETTSGSDEILPTVPVVISMSMPVDDLNAIFFAAQLYAAIAGGQSISSAFKQGKATVEAMSGDEFEAELPQVAARSDIDLNTLVLVRSLGV